MILQDDCNFLREHVTQSSDYTREHQPIDMNDVRFGSGNPIDSAPQRVPRIRHCRGIVANEGIGETVMLDRVISTESLDDLDLRPGGRERAAQSGERVILLQELPGRSQTAVVCQIELNDP